MAKVECLELKGQKCNFAFIGDLQFDQNGIVEIDHPVLLNRLKLMKGFRVLPDPPQAPTETPIVATPEKVSTKPKPNIETKKVEGK